MHMSRIKLDVGRVQTMKALASPQVMHAIIEGCFDGYRLPNQSKHDSTRDETMRILWRLDSLGGCLYLLIISEQVPDFTGLSSQLCTPAETGQTRDYGAFLSTIKNGQRLRFRFRANPVHSVPIAKGERGKVTPHVSEFHKREWLVKKAERCGFALEANEFAIVETRRQRFRKEKSRNFVELSCTTFEGVLTVTDAGIFTQALVSGIGRGKAYGCGLMTVMVV